jgi:hypothetical protein
MEIRNFLQKLLDFGKHGGYFKETTIGQLEKTCCEQSVTTVIDFDGTKDIVISEFALQTLKSSDALKIVPHTNRLDVIELKGFKKFMKYQLRSGGSAEAQVREKIESFELVGKIRDSIYILQTVAFSRKLELTKKERAVFYGIPKRFIVVVDIEMEKNPVEYIALTLSFLSEASTSIEKQVASILKMELDKIPGSPFSNIQKPQLMNCKSIDDYYACIDSMGK